MSRSAHIPLAYSSLSLVWGAVALAVVIPGGSGWLPPVLVIAILLNWRRPRVAHLWAAAVFCQLVALGAELLSPVTGAWLGGLLIGGFPSLCISLILMRLAERERPTRDAAFVGSH